MHEGAPITSRTLELVQRTQRVPLGYEHSRLKLLQKPAVIWQVTMPVLVERADTTATRL